MDAGFETQVDAPRGDVSREWELFVREEGDEPLRHAGSVSAPTVEVAREQAAQLFGWTAEALWLCPADETHRFAADDVALGDRAEHHASDADAAESEDGDTPTAATEVENR